MKKLTVLSIISFSLLLAACSNMKNESTGAPATDTSGNKMVPVNQVQTDTMNMEGSDTAMMRPDTIPH